MLSSAGIAGRYVKALFELADSEGKVDAVAGDLSGLETLIAETPELSRLVHSSVYGRDEQTKAMTTLLTAAKADDLVVRFVGVVCRNGRLFFLPRIIRVFLAELARRRGEISAEAVTAFALDASQEAQLVEAISGIAGSDKIALTARVDPSLIGGLVVRIGSRMIDTSIKTKLNRLEAAMKGVL